MFNLKPIKVDHTDPEPLNIENLSVGSLVMVLANSVPEPDSECDRPLVMKKREWVWEKEGIPFKIISVDLPYILVAGRNAYIVPAVLDVRSCKFMECSDQFYKDFYDALESHAATRQPPQN